MGSRVIRGHLLVVPIENSILYVTLYLRAETGQLPELKRAIAAYGDRVVMEGTLAEALAALFKESAPAFPLPGPPAAPSVPTHSFAASPKHGTSKRVRHYQDRTLGTELSMSFRRNWLTRPIFGWARRALPTMSLQHFQRPTPSHLSKNAPSLSRVGNEDVACSRRGRLKICETQVSRVLYSIT